MEIDLWRAFKVDVENGSSFHNVTGHHTTHFRAPQFIKEATYYVRNCLKHRFPPKFYGRRTFFDTL